NIYQELIHVLKEKDNEGFSDQEVQKIKNQYIASKVYEKESLEHYAFSLGNNLAQAGNIHADDDFIEKTKKVNNQEVHQALQTILRKTVHISLQIPQDADLTSYKKELENFQKSFLKTLSSNKIAKTPASKNSKTNTSAYDPQIHEEELISGVKLLYRQNTMTPTFILYAHLKGGLGHETKKDQGIHSLLAATLTKGYAGHDFQSIKLDLENKSANLHAFAGKDAYGLTLHGQSTHTPKLFEHFFGTLIQPNFDVKFIEHEKEILLRIIKNQSKDPVKTCFKTTNEFFFANHPYSLDALGTAETIKSFKKEILQTTHDNHLQNHEIVLTYCGDLSLQEIKNLLTPYLKNLPARPKKSFFTELEFPKKPLLKHLPFDREQTQILMVVPAFKTNDLQNVYLKVLESHLGGQSSELFVSVRDRQGLCYSVQPMHFNALQAGYFGIYMASGHDKKEAAIKAIKTILEKIKNNGFSEKEFKRLQEMIIGSSQMELQTNDDYANIYCIPTLHDLGIDFHYKNIESIKKMKREHLNKFLKQFLNQEMSIITVGRS
ncbi:MAG: insulinase family protein, partial [Bacteriovoracaceae bacterium]|nr:insulinase family protein [Bacteriovoracaceae bacterium]